MCGLVYVRSLDNLPANKRVWRRYLDQQERGNQGFGYVALDKKLSYHRFSLSSEVYQRLDKEIATEIMFHHRLPTSAPNLPEAAHPIRVKSKDLTNVFYVIHNGIINNDEALKLEHEKLGFKYTTEVKEETSFKVNRKRYYSKEIKTFNDSESLAIDLALFLSGKQEKITSRGSIAFICLETSSKGEPLFLHYGRNTNPLIIEKTKEFFALKSTGKGESIEANKLFSFSYATGQTSVNDVDIGEKSALCPTPYYWEREDKKESIIGFRSDNREELEENTDKISQLYDELEFLELEIADEKELLEYYETSKCLAEADNTRIKIAELSVKYEALENDMYLLTNYGTA